MPSAARSKEGSVRTGPEGVFVQGTSYRRDGYSREGGERGFGGVVGTPGWEQLQESGGTSGSCPGEGGAQPTEKQLRHSRTTEQQLQNFSQQL